jgi:hypothetical protein
LPPQTQNDREWFDNRILIIIFVLYGFIVVVLMLNILIAVVSDSYEYAVIRAKKLFMMARLDLVAEFDTMGLNDTQKRSSTLSLFSFAYRIRWAGWRHPVHMPSCTCPPAPMVMDSGHWRRSPWTFCLNSAPPQTSPPVPPAWSSQPEPLSLDLSSAWPSQPGPPFGSSRRRRTTTRRTRSSAAIARVDGAGGRPSTT